jgi:beta-glucosidase
VRGYFHWSLVDNFEWSEGWSARFGLHALARDTEARTLRPRGALYAVICRPNGHSDTLFGHERATLQGA